MKIAIPGAEMVGSAMAKEKQVIVITDIGVAPGMSNLIFGHYNGKMKIDSFEIYVGGLPKLRKKPFEFVMDYLNQRGVHWHKH